MQYYGIAVSKASAAFVARVDPGDLARRSPQGQNFYKLNFDIAVINAEPLHCLLSSGE